MSENRRPQPLPEHMGFWHVYHALDALRRGYTDPGYVGGQGGYRNGERTVLFQHGAIDTDRGGKMVVRGEDYHREQSYNPRAEAQYLERTAVLLNRIAIGAELSPPLQPNRETVLQQPLHTRIVGAYINSNNISSSFRQASVTGIRYMLDTFAQLYPSLTPALDALMQIGGAGGVQEAFNQTQRAMDDAISGALNRANLDEYGRTTPVSFVTPNTFPMSQVAYNEIKCAAPHLGNSLLHEMKRAAIDIASLLKSDPAVFPYQKKITYADLGGIRHTIKRQTAELLAVTEAMMRQK